MRLIFCGTSPFAIPTLKALATSDYELLAVVTQPARPAGRGRTLTPSPVARQARALDLPVWQPTSLKDAELQQCFFDAEPDMIVVVAYGQFLPKSLLELPPYCCINLHPSLLPKYRGPAPINWAILNGDTETGITTMYMSEQMDAGDLLLQETVSIAPMETSIELHDRLAKRGANLIIETIQQLDAGTLRGTAQDEVQVTLAPLLTKQQGLVDWSLPAAMIINQIRGLQPWPTAFTTLHGKPLKIFRAEIPEDRAVPSGAVPGTIIGLTRSLHIAAGDGRLCLTDVQLAGKIRMLSEVFLRGYQVKIGEVLT